MNLAAKSWLGKAGFTRWVFTGYGWVIMGFLRVFYGFPKAGFSLKYGNLWEEYGFFMGRI
jgi:hypothetical protein